MGLIVRVGRSYFRGNWVQWWTGKRAKTSLYLPLIMGLLYSFSWKTFKMDRISEFILTVRCKRMSRGWEELPQSYFYFVHLNNNMGNHNFNVLIWAVCYLYLTEGLLILNSLDELQRAQEQPKLGVKFRSVTLPKNLRTVELMYAPRTMWQQRYLKSSS